MRATSSWRSFSHSRRPRRASLLAARTRATCRRSRSFSLDQLLRELGAAPEQREHLLGPREQPVAASRSCRPSRPAADAPARQTATRSPTRSPEAATPRRPTPVRIACCGMPNTTAVCSDSATTRPPRLLTARTPSRPSSPIPVSTTAEQIGAEVLRGRREEPVDGGRVLVARPSRRRAARRRGRAPRSNSRCRPPGATSTCPAIELVAVLAPRAPRTGVSRSMRSAKPRVKPAGMCWHDQERAPAAPRRRSRGSASAPPARRSTSRSRRRAARRAPASRAPLTTAGRRRAAPAPSRCAAGGSRGPCAAAPARSSRARRRRAASASR